MPVRVQSKHTLLKSISTIFTRKYDTREENSRGHAESQRKERQSKMHEMSSMDVIQQVKNIPLE